MPHYVNIKGQRVEALGGCWYANAYTSEIKTSAKDTSEAVAKSELVFMRENFLTVRIDQSFSMLSSSILSMLNYIAL